MSDIRPTFRTVLADFIAFLRRPQLLAPAGLRAPGSLRVWVYLTLLTIGVLLGLILPLLHFWQSVFHLSDPVAFEGVSKQWLVPIVVLIAPPLEELLFRGWQSGTRGALWLLGCGLAGLIALSLATRPGNELLALALILAALIAALVGWLMLRRNRAPLAWFSRAFPLVYYTMAALFALVHLANYGEFSLIAVPLVLPQLWAGLMLGYLRQRIGLPASIAAHATSNLLVVGLALLVSPT
jgi:membrane protease YdiL (CAAX protease family)